MTRQALVRTNRVLTGGTWVLIAGVVFYSLMTTTPFVASHSAWKWSGAALGLMTDVAFVMALQAESVLARHGVDTKQLGPWPPLFRWFTGGATVFLNIWDSVARRDPVGVAVHLIAPALLMIVAEVAPVYRAAMARLIAYRTEAGVDTVDTNPVHPASTPASVPSTPVPAERASAAVPEPSPLVICGGQQAYSPAVPPASTNSKEEDAPAPKLEAREALNVIRVCWVAGTSLAEAAERSTRSTSYVHKVYQRLNAEQERPPVLTAAADGA